MMVVAKSRLTTNLFDNHSSENAGGCGGLTEAVRGCRKLREAAEGCRMTRGGGSGGLPTRPTRLGVGAPKARGPPRVAGSVTPKGWCPQNLGFPKGWWLVVAKYNSDLEAEFGNKIIHFHEHLQSLQKKKSSANPKTVIADICEILNSTAEAFPICQELFMSLFTVECRLLIEHL
jgi:hypothetical protein